MKRKHISKALSARLDIITRAYWLSMIPTRSEVADYIAKGSLAIAIGLASTSANADGYPECRTKIQWVATINNQVAMTPVQFILRDSKTNAIVTQTTNHSGTYALPCGNYTATATLGNVTRGREISANTYRYTLIIEMGA